MKNKDKSDYDSALGDRPKNIPKPIIKHKSAHQLIDNEVYGTTTPPIATERNFFATDEDQQDSGIFSQELKNKFKALPDEDPIILPLGHRARLEDDRIIKDSFESIAEPVPEAQVKEKIFLNSKSRASCCSILTFWFANTLIDSISHNKGKMDDRMIEDMNSDPKRDQSLLRYFQKKLSSNIEAFSVNSNDKDSSKRWYELTKSTIWSTIKCQFFLTGFVSLIAEILSLISIFTIKFLADYLTKDESDSREAVVLVVIFSASLILGSLLRHFYIYYGYSMSLELRKMLISAMYDKIGKLSMRSLTETNQGKLITLVSQDIFSIERPLAMAPFGLALPLINLVCYAMIWYIVGWQYSVIIFGLWILSLLCQCGTTFIQKKIKISEAKRNDQRLRFVSDMIRGIRTIKSQAYERHYGDKVHEQRANQVKYTFLLNMIGNMGFSFFQNFGFIAILCITIPQWYQDQKLEVGDIFTLLALNYYLFFNVNSLTYYSITTMSQFYAVIYRLSKILKMQEQKIKRQQFIMAKDNTNDDKEFQEPLISLKGAEYAWGFRISQLEDQKNRDSKIRLDVENICTPVLQKISMQVLPNELMIVVGASGAGKTSLLYSLMDEMILNKGEHNVNGRISYVEQDPFLFDGTIKENICFGLEYAECRFRKATNAALLRPNEENFRHGWDTVIEDRGKHLQKSQKVRISLARALYQDADIYLLDNFLQDVEPITASKIFTDAIKGILADKCVILVSNQPQYLGDASKIMCLRNGEQVAIGSYDQLAEQGVSIHDIFQQNRRKDSFNTTNPFAATERKKNDQLLNLVKSNSMKITGKDYVNQINKSVTDIDQNSSINEEEEAAARLRRRQRERNIKMLRKQVLALSQEELSSRDQLSNKLHVMSKGDYMDQQTVASATLNTNETRRLTRRDLVVDEEYIDNQICWSDYKKFLNFSYGTSGIITLVVISLLTAVAQLLPSIWLSEWLVQDQEQQKDTRNPTIFGLLILGFLIFTLIRSIVLFKVILKSSSNIHKQMAEKVLRSKIQFFDQHRFGSIVSRFSQDLLIFDLVIPIVSMIVVHGFFRTGTVVVMIAVINPWMIFIIVFCAILIFLTMKKGARAMIETQRQDSVLRTPIQSSLQKMIHGMVSLRAADKTNLFRQEFMNDLKQGTNATYCFIIANRWIAFRLDILCCVFISFVCFFLVLMKDKIDQSLLVMSLQVATDIIFLVSISFRMYSEIESHMVSSKRMIAYTELEQEDELVKPGDDELERQMWPTQGTVDFEQCTMRYRCGIDPSINNLTFSSKSGMRIGIIGQTGSGKSSILQTLYRFVELESGRNSIDGVDIKTVGLHLLRKSISFVPQSPFLIRGTIRENIDPQGMSIDSQIDFTLRELNMYEKVYALPMNLDTQISESNNLFSIGQKQLLCLARAIIQKSKIVVFDEASSYLDMETDNLIQRVLRERLNNCTVFVVAHRIATIIDADRIMVMKDGELQEYSHPYKLLVEQEGDQTVTNIRGQFAKMCISLGVEKAHDLFEITQSVYQSFQNKFYEPLKNSLSVTDNRTGKTYELQIQDNTILATQLLQIKTVSGNVTRSYDPSYKNTVNCKSKICYIDGEKGILEYRGIPIDQLTRRSRFIETSFLLIYGQLPSKEQLLNFDSRVRANYHINEQLQNFIDAYRQDNMKDSHPMSMMQTLISCLSSCNIQDNYFKCSDTRGYNTQEKRDIHINRVLGQVPSIAAACLRIFQKKDLVEPNMNMGFVHNFLRMCFGQENEIAKNRTIIKAMEAIFILHAEHELNCSTAALRHMASTLADVYTSLSGSVTSLNGPRNGGACEQVLEMLQEIGKVENVPAFINQVKMQERQLFGFGHRVYKNYDPRAAQMKQIAEQVFVETGREELIDIAMELERVTANDQYFVNSKLYPNMNFYSGIIFKAIGFPNEFFTVLIPLPRFAGWMSHWNEFVEDPDNKIVRPRQIYTGERGRNYIYILDRLPEELCDYKVKDYHGSAQINLPTIYSCGDSSSRISMTQTDKSFDYDRRLMIQRKQSKMSSNVASNEKDGQMQYCKTKKSQFIVNVDNEISSQTQSQESRKLSFENKDDQLEGQNILRGSVIQIDDQSGEELTAKDKEIKSDMIEYQSDENQTKSKNNIQFSKMHGPLTPDQSLQNIQFGLNDDSMRSIPDECVDNITSKL